MSSTRLFYWLTLSAYFALLCLVLAWFSWLAPPRDVPRSLPLAGLGLPLLFPVRGLLYGRRYTYQWSSLLCLFYFMIGVDTWYNRADVVGTLGMWMTILSLLWFAGSVGYARATRPSRQ